MKIPFNEMFPEILRELIILPGIKTERASMMRASPGRRAAMFAAGPVVSMLVPLAVAGFALTVKVPPLYLSLVRQSQPILLGAARPDVAALVTLPVHELVRMLFPLLALCLLFLSMWFSPQVGCLSKARRARGASGSSVKS